MLAYHNDPKIKAKFLRRLRAHRKADEITQYYGYWRHGRGCAVGCTMHVDDNPHARYPTELGFPEELAWLEDHFFENLPPDVAKKWPERFLAAIQVGADLSSVYDFWSAWNLIDPEHGVLRLVSDDFPEVRRIVQETADDCLAGKRVNDTKRQGAALAARAAWADWAAEEGAYYSAASEKLIALLESAPVAKEAA